MIKTAFIFLVTILLVGAVLPAGAQDASEVSARVRVVHGVLDGPTIDIIANDESLVEALTFTQASRFEAVTPGIVRFAVMSADDESNAPIIEPEALTLEADHDYVIIVMGLVGQDNVQLVSIDLTAAFDNFETPDGHADMLLVNGLKGVDAISATVDDNPQTTGLAFGEFVATSALTKTYHHQIVVAERTLDALLDSDVPDGLLPGTRNMLIVVGEFELGYGFTFVRDSAMNSLDLLQVMSEVESPLYGTFESFLAAIDQVELRDKLANEGPFIIVAPNDAAFDELDPVLLDDPDALNDVVLYHVTEELVEVVDESVTLTTLQGGTIEIIPGSLGVLVNTALLQTSLIETKNGFVALINEVLIPPEE